MLFDSHCHLQNDKFDGDREAVLGRARQAGVSAILNLATRSADAPAVVALARQHPECWAAVGVHPSDIDDWSPESEAVLRGLAGDPRVVAWGEIGLDYYWKTHAREDQRRVFRRQLAIARELGLPVSMHCRDAYDDLLADLRAEDGAAIGGVAHCFMGTLDHARAFLDLGFALGIGGSATYKGNQALRDTLLAVGPGDLVVETDSPYLAPVPHRGKRNEPAFAADTAAALAALFGMEPAAFAEASAARARRAFRIPVAPA